MNITITLGSVNSYITIDGNALEEKTVLDLCDKACSFMRHNYFFSTAYRKGQYDGKKHLFNTKQRSFPTGLFFRLAKAFEKANLTECICLENADVLKVTLPIHPVSQKPDREYRQYQEESLQAALTFPRGVFRLATNAGKTAIMCDIVEAYGLPKTIVVVPNKTLLYQTSDTFKASFGKDKIGLIGEGKFQSDAQLIVATAQTLGSKKRKKEVIKLLEQVELLLIDETHHVGINSWYKIAMLCTAKYRFGFSGTAFDRTDGADMMLEAACGVLLKEVSNKDLIDLGVSCPVVVHMHTEDSMSIKKGDVEDYEQLVTEGIVMNPYRNKKIITLIKDSLANNKQVLVAVHYVKHGQILYELLKESGLGDACVFVQGEVEGEDRSIILQAFKEGLLKVIVATVVFAEGVDVPNVDVLIQASSGKSKIAALQWIGRGIRNYENKVLHLHDFWDKTHKDILMKHSRKRFKHYQNEHFDFADEGKLDFGGKTE